MYHDHRIDPAVAFPALPGPDFERLTLSVTFDYAVHVRAGKRADIVFVRDDATVQIDRISDIQLPLVARYVTPVESIELRQGPQGLLAAAWSMRGVASRRVPVVFPEFLVAGIRLSEADLAAMPILRSERAATLRKVQAAAGASLAIGQVVYRPTGGLIVGSTGNGMPFVDILERHQTNRRIDPASVFDVTDPLAPACRGLEVLNADLARGAWQRLAEVRKAACDAILEGLQVDLIHADGKLMRRWVRLVEAYRLHGADQEILQSCDELLTDFSKKGLAQRATRLRERIGHLP